MSYATVRDELAKAAADAGREETDVTLIVVSKTHPIEAILDVYDQGHRDFGENRAQELARKVAELPEDIRWHMVGPLQRNKVRLVRDVVTLLHSMDGPKLARAWARPGLPSPPALLQVNIGSEAQKMGVEPAEAVASFDAVQGIGVELVGLMAIPPNVAEPDRSREYFRQLREIRDELAANGRPGLELSMGMSNDFGIAVEEGSTMIRVGRAIFGPRLS